MHMCMHMHVMCMCMCGFERGVPFVAVCAAVDGSIPTCPHTPFYTILILILKYSESEDLFSLSTVSVKLKYGNYARCVESSIQQQQQRSVYQKPITRLIYGLDSLQTPVWVSRKYVNSAR